MILRLKDRIIEFPRRPLIMGIVNINDDSFSGDGSLDPSKALALAAEHISNGADIIDVGAESARPNRPPISEEEEIERLRPFLLAYTEMANKTPKWDDEQLSPPILSVNSWRPKVIEASLQLGVDLINDMSALPAADNAALCAAANAGLLIMHSIGAPKENHRDQTYTDVLDTLRDFFAEKIEMAVSVGLSKDQIIIDPGIDFAKQPEDDLRIFKELETLCEFQRPILLPVSRKSVIGKVLELDNPSERDAGTIGCIAATAGAASIFRVHNVKAAAESTKIIRSIGA